MLPPRVEDKLSTQLQLLSGRLADAVTQSDSEQKGQQEAV